MMLLAFFIGLAILVCSAAAGRRLVYFFLWACHPREMDEDLDDVVFGWFMGAVVAFVMTVMALLAIAIGGVVLSVTCDVTQTGQVDTQEKPDA